MRVSLVSGGVGWGESAYLQSEVPESVPRVCPIYFLEDLCLELTVFGTVIQLLGLGIGLRLVGVSPLKVVVSTRRLTPWEAGVRSGGGQICSESFSDRGE